jgi:hypothetical protein
MTQGDVSNGDVLDCAVASCNGDLDRHRPFPQWPKKKKEN